MTSYSDSKYHTMTQFQHVMCTFYVEIFPTLTSYSLHLMNAGTEANETKTIKFYSVDKNNSYNITQCTNEFWFYADQLDHCPRLSITNGRITHSNQLQRGSSALFTCDQHYYWNGTIERTCQDNGEWSGEGGNCSEFHLSFDQCKLK